MSKIEESLEKAAVMRDSKDIKSQAPKKQSDDGIPIKISSPFILHFDEPDSKISEGYRRLKAMVLRATKVKFLNTLMVTSSLNGEGKSITAINFALALAQELNQTTLLVDADLKNPMIHNYLGIQYKYGLSDYLLGKVDLSDILIKTNAGNLVILPAGSSVNNPVELLSSEKMKNLIVELKQRYMDRYIIFDTAPSLLSAEAIRVGSWVDGIIFVVKERGAQKDVIKDALDLLREFNILGMVYNQARINSFDGNGIHYNYYYAKQHGQ